MFGGDGLVTNVWLFVTPWTIACQAPLSKVFSRQEYWSGLPFPLPGYLPKPGIKPVSPALQAMSLSTEPPGKFINIFKLLIILVLISLLKILLNDLEKQPYHVWIVIIFSCPNILSMCLVQCGEAVKIALVVNTCRMCCAGAKWFNLHLCNPHNNARDPWYHCSILQVMKLKDREVFVFNFPKVTQMASSKFRIWIQMIWLHSLYCSCLMKLLLISPRHYECVCLCVYISSVSLDLFCCIIFLTY